MKIYYTPLAWDKCLAWTRNAGRGEDGRGALQEVAWMQEVEVKDKYTILIKDCHLLGVSPLDGSIYGKQVGGSSEIDVTEEMVSRFYNDWIRSGRRAAEIRGWGHSHTTGSVFQSSQDKDTTRDRFGRRGFCVACTWNVKGEVFAELTVFEPFHLVVSDIKPEVFYPESDIDLKALHELCVPARYTYVGSKSSTPYDAGKVRYSPFDNGKKYEYTDGGCKWTGSKNGYSDIYYSRAETVVYYTLEGNKDRQRVSLREWYDKHDRVAFPIDNPTLLPATTPAPKVDLPATNAADDGEPTVEEVLSWLDGFTFEMSIGRKKRRRTVLYRIKGQSIYREDDLGHGRSTTTLVTGTERLDAIEFIMHNEEAWGKLHYEGDVPTV